MTTPQYSSETYHAPCANCELLRKLIGDLSKQLMSFHKAGQQLAENQVRLADAETRKAEAEAEKAKAEAVRERALTDGGRTVAQRVPGATSPRFGTRGHERVIAHPPATPVSP